MAEVKRLHFTTTAQGALDCTEHQDGGFVHYSDYAALDRMLRVAEREKIKDLEKRIRNQRTDCEQSQLRNRYYKRVIAAIIANEPKVFLEFKAEARIIDEVLYIETLADSEERLRKAITQVVALERRLRIAWRIIGKLVDVNNETSHELFHEAEREIDAEQKEHEG